MVGGMLSLLTGKDREESADKSSRAAEIQKLVVGLEGSLRSDWTKRVSGDGIYVGYKTLRDFYRGRQWTFKKDGNGTMRTYNYCFTIVENMTAFLTNEAPQMSCPADDISKPLERSLAEGRSRILRAIHDENDLSLVFQRAVRTGSINGDSFVFGPIPTFKTGDDGAKTFDAIRYWNIEKPENIRPIWKDDNFNELAGFVKQYRLDLETAKRLFASEIKEHDLRVVEDRAIDNITSDPIPTEVPMCTVREYWDDRDYALMLGASSVPVHYMRHDWNFVPGQYVPNIHLPGESHGTSDLENELDAQMEYNERASDLADIIKEIAQPTYWGKNLDNITEVRSGQKVIYSVGDDAEINAMPKSGQTAPVQEYLQDRKNDIIGLSGLNSVLYPGSQVLGATGRALSVIMQGVNNKVSLRKEWWIRAWKEINKGILFLAEIYVPDAASVIDGHYRTDVFISSVLLRDVNEEINKFQSKLQSLTTTQQNIGVPNPSEEQKLMKEELQDEVLATEIAKQPGLLHQILQEKIQQQAAQDAQGGAAPGQPAAAPIPIGGPANNEPQPRPVAGRPSPVSPAGAIAQRAQRSGAPTRANRTKR